MTNTEHPIVERSSSALATQDHLAQYENWYRLDDAAPAVVDRSSRIGVWALLVGLGAFMLWATFAPLDEGVPGPGSVAIDTKRKPVQHLTGGLIKEVLVREGEKVTEGQVLARLDDANSKANFQGLREHYLGLRAAQGRLEAESRGARTIEFHQDLLANPDDQVSKSLITSQKQLLDSRLQALDADMQAFEENIQGQRAMMHAYEASLNNRRSQMALLTEELNNTRALVKEGFAPRNRQLELERLVTDANTGISDLLGNIQRTTRAINETQQRAKSRRSEYRKEVESQLADVVREVQSDELKVRAARDDFGRTEIKAPSSGQVMGLLLQAPGTVLAPGQRLMDIVPENAALLVEAHVNPNHIDKVHAGLPVDIRFSSFANSPLLTVQGELVSVSKDLTEQQGVSPYYLARVAITESGKKTLGARQLQPGMPVEVVFKTGQRTLLDYLLHPLAKRMAAAMKEE